MPLTAPKNKDLAKIVVAFLFAVFVFTSGIYVGRVTAPSNVLSSSTSNSNGYSVTGDIKSTVDNVNVNLLWEVWSTIDQGYLNKSVNGQNLLYGAVKGLVSGLNDPYTNFLTPDETKAYEESNAGQFEGIGASLKQDGDYVSVESPVDGTPAQKAGLKPGDVIAKVDGNDMKGKSVYTVASVIRGTAGTSVKLTIYRPSTDKQFDLTIVRQKITIDNIALQDLGNGILKIKIYKFTEASVYAFNSLWDKVVQEALAKNPKALVIDLRNNPGGYVDSVEYAIGEFLPKGTTIFSEEDRDGNITPHVVNRTGKFLNLPITVLVNEGSASASEIFTGAMQDNGRATVIGAKTVGKGVEQRVLTLSDGSTLELVFQKWLLPKGRNITKDNPITPDVQIEDYDQQDAKALENLQQKLH